MNTKEQIKKIIYYIGWRALGAFVFVTVAGTSLWALAAFTEPTTTPGNSVQDFVTNILGANNANNAFDSSNVTANANGSIIERLEALEQRTAGPTALSAQFGTYSYSDANIVCHSRSEEPEYILDESKSSLTTTYTDWRLPSQQEMIMFSHFDIPTATSYDLWTSLTPHSENHAFTVSLTDPRINTYVHVSTQKYFRCVR